MVTHDIPTLSAAHRSLMQALQPHYDLRECRQIADWVLSALADCSTSERLTHPDRHLSSEQAARLDDAAARLRSGEPVQYVLGEIPWRNLTLFVSPDALIPRPETAELIDLIADRYAAHDAPVSILDWGTGSGCLAIALARLFPQSRVTAADVSARALSLAGRNASRHACPIRLVQADLLSPEAFADESFDLVVSNPPYIEWHERPTLAPHVAAHEPASALFVPDGRPLLFYDALLRFARTHLTPGGYLYAEAHAAHAAEVHAAWQSAALGETALHADAFDRPRFVSLQRRL